MAKHKVAERQIARILALVEHEALSAIEIAARLHMSITSAGRFVARLLAEKPRSRRLYIADWRHGASPTRPVRILRAGRQPDVRYVPMVERKGPHRLRAEADRKRAEVLALLAMPQTTQQLSVRMGVSESRIKAYIREHRAAGRIHIKAWVLPVYRGSQSAVYALGNQPDKQRVRGARDQARKIKPSAFGLAMGALMEAGPSCSPTY
jgi:hypothetical protein